MRNPIKNRFLLILLLLACGVGVVAQQPDRLQQDVKYLASDALEGRRTGSKGATEAANYIAKEFARLGLKPLAEPAGRKGSESRSRESRYLQSFPYVAGVRLGKENGFLFSHGPTAESPVAVEIAGTDWLPLGFSSSAKIESDVVFVGYAITASELNHNDYANANATGKIVIALQGTPDGANPHGQFGRFEAVRWKAVAARNAGAKALVVIAREQNFKDDRLTRLVYDNLSGDAGLPVIILSRQAADRLLKTSGFSVAELEQSPAARPLKGNLLLTTDVVRSEVAAYNVAGMIEGSDPVLKKEVIIIGAHYDHLGRGGEDSGSLAPTSGEIHHGADDNASGTAGVLELARLFTAQEPKPKHTIIFLAFGGEEEGLLGSNYYVNHPLLPLANTVAMINMYMF